MAGQPSHSPKQPGSSQSQPATPPSGVTSGAAQVSQGPNSRWVLLRRAIAMLVLWLFFAFVTAALLNDGLGYLKELGLPIELKLTWWGRFFWIFIPSFIASTAFIVVGERIKRVEEGVEKVVWFIIDHREAFLLLLMLTATGWFAFMVAGDVPPPPNENLHPQPSSGSTTTATTITATSTPIAPPVITEPSPETTITETPTAESSTWTDLTVLCASNALKQDIVRDSSVSIQPEAFTSLDRYSSRPTLKDLVAKLYPNTGYSFGGQICDGKKIVSTMPTGDWNEADQIVFDTPQSRQSPVQAIWIIMSASNTAGQKPSNDPIGEILARFSDRGSPERLTLLWLGGNIADWQYRGRPAPGVTDELQTVTDVNLQAVSPRDDRQPVRRLLSDYEIDTTERKVGRAAQLLAIRAFATPDRRGDLLSVMIRDEPGGPSLDVLAVVLVPAGMEADQPAPDAPVMHAKTSQPVCTTRAVSNQGNWSWRAWDAEILPEETYGFQQGCDTATPLPDLDPDVNFYFDRILATKLDSEEERGDYRSQIELNVTNTIHATHLYLIMSVRNLCVAHGSLVGHITINGHTGPYNLVAGENIRQGRTNLSQANCKSGDHALLLDAIGQQHGAPDIVTMQGVAVRSKQTAWTDDKSAELWFDLVKVKLPDEERITITIANKVLQTAQADEPFITLYAAALVREVP